MPMIGPRDVTVPTKGSLLQRELGDLGQVLPYMQRGVGACVARGWYARIGGELVFLGDHIAIALKKIFELREEP